MFTYCVLCFVHLIVLGEGERCDGGSDDAEDINGMVYMHRNNQFNHLVVYV
jgi:hypothetical protein